MGSPAGSYRMKPISAVEIIVLDRSQRGDSGSPKSRSQSPWWKNSGCNSVILKSYIESDQKRNLKPYLRKCALPKKQQDLVGVPAAECLDQIQKKDAANYRGGIKTWQEKRKEQLQVLVEKQKQAASNQAIGLGPKESNNQFVLSTSNIGRRSWISWVNNLPDSRRRLCEGGRIEVHLLILQATASLLKLSPTSSTTAAIESCASASK